MYSWRHDSVFHQFYQSLQERQVHINSLKVSAYVIRVLKQETQINSDSTKRKTGFPVYLVMEMIRKCLLIYLIRIVYFPS